MLILEPQQLLISVRAKLSNLDHAMREQDSDIEHFNDYVIVNLFKGYKACKDAEFVVYIKKKEDLYEEGSQVDYQ